MTPSARPGYVADTSVFVAAEQGRPLGATPSGDSRVSVATLTELAVGVRRAPRPDVREVRTATLARAQRYIALPYDEAVAHRLADLLAAARSAGRRAGAMDAIIAATAMTHGLAVWTQDDDFDMLADLDARLVVHRG